jgi:hypothetical protein
MPEDPDAYRAADALITELGTKGAAAVVSHRIIRSETAEQRAWWIEVCHALQPGRAGFATVTPA